MSRTPTTPFIPPLLSPHPSPNTQPSPVIPPYTPAFAPSNYPVYPASSPQAHSPFIPPSPSGFGTNLPPAPTHSRHPSRQGGQGGTGGLSADYTGYPPTGPGPTGHTPPMATPMHMQAPYGPLPGWPGPPTAPVYGGFQTNAGWPGNATPYSYGASPYMHSNNRIPPPAAAPYNTPFTPGYGAQLPPPGPQWGPPQNQPQMQPQYGFGPQPPMGGDAWNIPPPQGQPMGHHYRHGPEPPMPVHDRMEPFATGPHYGPVLDPMLIKIVNAPVKINPLISPPVEEGPEQPYLKWDMLFETSFVQRSDEPAHQSWMNGRGAPATFPRLSSLRLITTQIPWMIDVVARDLERGVTCEEVIEAIAHNLGKSSSNSDYACLHRHDQAELSHAYRYNRSPNPGVPGGRLKEAMKRLDYLRTNTSFGGIVVDDRTVKRLCGSELPCVFVLKCNKRFMSQKDVQEHETRMRRAAGGTSRAASKGPPSARSRGHSPNGMITVHPPSSSSYTTDSDEGGVDR